MNTKNVDSRSDTLTDSKLIDWFSAPSRRGIGRFIKRLFDIIFSGIGLIISFPIWVLSSVAIIMESGGPVFIWQKRVRKGGNVFRILKFRSMDKKAHIESPANHVGNREEHITMIGRIIRATAMDELPQLISILLGDMSFVGPRPMHPEEPALNESKYQKLSDVPDFDKRCSMKPGLTGIAQVYAPKDLSIEKKVKYDLLYVKRQSFILDIKLILLSFWVTLKGRWEEGNRGVKGLLVYREVRSKDKRGHLLRSIGANLTDSLPKRHLKQSLFALISISCIVLIFFLAKFPIKIQLIGVGIVVVVSLFVFKGNGERRNIDRRSKSGDGS
ncbi:sugar transferase [candidate division WOR-3 bacterium]|nr:sugar transferase [candidate division WOR-3 bacterium]